MLTTSFRSSPDKTAVPAVAAPSAPGVSTQHDVAQLFAHGHETAELTGQIVQPVGVWCRACSKVRFMAKLVLLAPKAYRGQA